MMKPRDPIILLTRPKAAADVFVHQLKEAGVDADVLVSSVQGIKKANFEEPNALAGAIFTSRNGVEAVKGRDAPCWCVGVATADAARAKGWQAVSADGDAEAVFKRIIADRPSGRLVHFRGKYARGNLAERLSEEGINAHEVVVYKQISLPLSQTARTRLARENPVILPLFSPRSAAQLVQQGPFTAPLWVIAMSETVAGEAVALSPARMEVSATPDSAGMIAAIRQMENAAYGIESDRNSS